MGRPFCYLVPDRPVEQLADPASSMSSRASLSSSWWSSPLNVRKSTGLPAFCSAPCHASALAMFDVQIDVAVDEQDRHLDALRVAEAASPRSTWGPDPTNFSTRSLSV